MGKKYCLVFDHYCFLFVKENQASLQKRQKILIDFQSVKHRILTLSRKTNLAIEILVAKHKKKQRAVAC